MSAKEELIETVGTVDEVLPGNMYRVILEGTTHQTTCYLGGKLKRNRIKILRGDNVKVELSPYDLSKGRVVWRN
jgi:translation initiation factor IF-1